MTSRERILTAMRRGIPDCVPAMPDISNMVPVRLTGKPFWDIYVHDDPPLDEAYVDAVRYFGMDGWYIYNNATMHEDPPWHKRIIHTSEKEIHVRRWFETPFGELSEIVCYPVADPPWPMKSMIENIAVDFPKLRWYMEQKSLATLCANQAKIGELGIYGVAIESFMGFWVGVRHGGSTQAIMDFVEEPEKMLEIRDFYLGFSERAAREIIKHRPDEILIGASSSSLSLSSPRIYREFDLPMIRLVSSLCKESDLICHQHTCGRSRLIVEINYAETDISVMEPLERPPGGDVELAEVKRRFGDKFCLKGNVNTFETMLNGSVGDVRQEAMACIDAAAAGGGFILATGDQCGRDTPDENIFALIEVARTYGRY
jgi:uroporphyrinogen decarboxylase